jgi:hypothetical protein
MWKEAVVAYFIVSLKICLGRLRQNTKHLGFEVLETVSRKSILVWDVTMCKFVVIYQCFGRIYCLNHQGWLHCLIFDPGF